MIPLNLETMNTRIVEERVGEKVGPLDWSYDFTQHDWSGSRGGCNPESTARNAQWLRELEAGLARGEAWEATTDGGWPRVGWSRVIDTGMYDGWPHWRPTPSVLLSGPLGATWQQFYALAETRRIADTPERTNDD